MDNTVALAAIGLAGSITAGFFRLTNKQIKTHEKIAKGLSDLADETKGLKLEARKGNKEAKQRNGHLAEIVIQQGEITRDNMNKPINVQTVETQVVSERK